ncbi:MAG: HD domain-containing protein [Clostridia bacterium]|nr:HD domain-containing protein [Clostridia bacterium]
MLPTRDEAEHLLREAEACNPGPWGNHSRVTAHCAERIASACVDLDADKAYILGLLHDIGRKFGIRHLGHVSDGYTYMVSLGYGEVARVCLTHSFHNKDLGEYIGKVDVTREEYALLQKELEEVILDEYDRLIQLCDALAGAEGVLDIEERMADVKSRYGFYPQAKWDANLALKRHFEEKTGQNIYTLVEKETFSI